MGLSIDKTYKFIQFVANKQHRGWISPDEINLAAEIAQLSLYSEKEANFMITKKIGADMIPFKDRSGDLTPASGLITFPEDYRHLIRLYNKSTFQGIIEVTQAELPDIMTSSIIAPSTAYPIVVERSDGLQIYPITYSSVCIAEYLAKPSTVPSWGYTISGGRPVHNPAGDVDFEFDEVLFKEISSRMLQYVGINLKDSEVAQFATMFQQKEAN